MLSPRMADARKANGQRAMQFNVRMMVTLGCLGVLTMSVPAFGQPINASKPATLNQRPLFGWPKLVSEARKYMGTNPTARDRLWCATFMNMVLAKTGHSGTNSDAAKSFAQYGRRISEPRIGAIAVLTRGKKGGHVGVVSGIDANGNPIIISGNHNKRVGEATYARSRVIAYVMPAENRGPTQLASNSGTSNHVSRPAAQDDGIDSPITELIAAIEAEARSDAARPDARQAFARHEPAQTARQTGRRDLPLDPRLAGLLGLKPDAKPAPRIAPLPQVQARPPQVKPQRQAKPKSAPQPQPQRSLRVAQR